jgi:hypothetical protein
MLLCGLLLLLAGCEVRLSEDGSSCGAANYSLHSTVCAAVDLPAAMRAHNWGGGSCTYAAFCDVLRWQGHEREAAYVRTHFAGAAGVAEIVAVADRLQLDFAYTASGEVAFLDWVSKTRRAAVIFWRGQDGAAAAHAITFCGFAGDQAIVVDNNSPNKQRKMPRAAFLAEWQRNGGVAITLVGRPPPPRPWF